jgi:hypothetical protein
MPQQPRHSKQPPQTLDKATIDRMHDDGLSYRAIAKQLSTNYARVYRAAHPTPSNGDHPEPTSGIPEVYQPETSGVPAIPEGIPVTPDSIPEVAWRGAIESRLDVIESFIAAAQQRAHGIPVTPESIPGIPESIPARMLTPSTTQPTKKHSFVIALDLLDEINAFAEAHHLEIKAVLDLALRRFFAREGER